MPENIDAPSIYELGSVAGKYHFLHYYKAFRFGATRFPRPDPPCLCMEC
jgi:hypothetical protein